jgi:cytochrome c
MFKFSKSAALLAGAVALLGIAAIEPAAQDKKTERFNIGRAATPEEIKGWDIDVRGDDGAGLPPGKGSVAGSGALSAAMRLLPWRFGEGKPLAQLMGSKGTLTSTIRIRPLAATVRMRDDLRLCPPHHPVIPRPNR